MKTVLGRKQNTPNEKWVEVFQNIEEYVTRDEMSQFAEKTVSLIKEKTAGLKAAFAWSGGKDSLVLADLCRKAGVSNSVFAYTDLEYPAFQNWCMENKPQNCTAVCTGQNLEWLSKHPDMVFPDTKGLNQWYQIVQRRVFTRYFFDEKLDVLLVGHRRADGNFTGKDGEIQKSSGEKRFAPLYDWPHEMVLAYIHYNNIPMPPIYDWPDGFRCGTHPWPSRVRKGTMEDCYKAVFSIDEGIVREAAQTIQSAKDFLESEVSAV